MTICAIGLHNDPHAGSAIIYTNKAAKTYLDWGQGKVHTTRYQRKATEKCSISTLAKWIFMKASNRDIIRQFFITAYGRHTVEPVLRMLKRMAICGLFRDVVFSHRWSLATGGLKGRFDCSCLWKWYTFENTCTWSWKCSITPQSNIPNLHHN